MLEGPDWNELRIKTNDFTAFLTNGVNMNGSW